MESNIDIFQEFIKKRGMRFTREREAIAREALAADGHFDVDELLLRLRKKTKISKACVYRTIPLLIKAGLITELCMDNGHMFYDHVLKPNHSIRCARCRRVMEFEDQRLEQIEKEIGERFGFKTSGHKFEIMGLCPECADNGSP